VFCSSFSNDNKTNASVNLCSCRETFLQLALALPVSRSTGLMVSWVKAAAVRM